MRHFPNILAALRLGAAPATAWLLLARNFPAAFGVFALAALSDAADGFLARTFGLKTRFGRILDPAADKALMLASFVTLAYLGLLPVWLAALVIGRDIFIVVGVAALTFLRAPFRIAPLFVGKLSTVLQALYVGGHLASAAFGFSLRALSPWDAYVFAAVTLGSALAYAGVGVRALHGLSLRVDAGA